VAVPVLFIFTIGLILLLVRGQNRETP